MLFVVLQAPSFSRFNLKQNNANFNKNGPSSSFVLSTFEMIFMNIQRTVFDRCVRFGC